MDAGIFFPDPAGLKRLDIDELEALSEDLRQRIISVCLKNGGHLGASLGTVELTIALHRVFDSPNEPIIWDVGHQAYAHKLLTGRDSAFECLRSTGGLSGFLSRTESEHDFFGAGHSSTSISAALGASYSRKGDTRWTVAVIGDGGLTAGLALEALNNVRAVENPRTLIVLNDNQMSISQNVGAIPSILADGSARGFFESFGLDYIGPIDGHRLPTLIGCIEGIRSGDPQKPILLHVLTQKGKGYLPAEESPSAYHGVSPVSQKLRGRASESVPKSRSFSEAFGQTLCDRAAKDSRIIAITAAMPDGTGLLEFSKQFPERFFDVGIAEAHAVTFAAGLAADGYRPVVAIYSTFLQRAIDGIIHDVALQHLPVVFAIDRAGLVGADGPTHHGAFDLSLLGPIPGLTLYCPSTLNDMGWALDRSLADSGPSAIRYPRGGGPEDDRIVIEDGIRWYDMSPMPQLFIVALGSSSNRARKAYDRLSAEEKSVVTYVSCLRAKPIPQNLITALKSVPTAALLIVEDGAIHGGFGQTLTAALGPRSGMYDFAGYPDAFTTHGSVSDLESSLNISADALLVRARRLLETSTVSS